MGGVESRIVADLAAREAPDDPQWLEGDFRVEILDQNALAERYIGLVAIRGSYRGVRAFVGVQVDDVYPLGEDYRRPTDAELVEARAEVERGLEIQRRQRLYVGSGIGRKLWEVGRHLAGKASGSPVQRRCINLPDVIVLRDGQRIIQEIIVSAEAEARYGSAA